MSVTNASLAQPDYSEPAVPEKIRRDAQGPDPIILADVFEAECNIAIWKRGLSGALEACVDDFVAANPAFETSLALTPKGAPYRIPESLGARGYSELCADMTSLVEMFFCLFGVERVGLRLTVLDRARCPRFHVDRVPCRLLCTYRGVGTDWLPHDAVDRGQLGSRSHGKNDLECGLYESERDIRRLDCGDVAILKGERWEGNENAGLVHRSPIVSDGARRLLLTLDFCD